MTFHNCLKPLSIQESDSLCTGTVWKKGNATEIFDIISPIDNSQLAAVQSASQEDLEYIVRTAKNTFQTWRSIPAPKRGEIIRQLGNAFRKEKKTLAKVITAEMGKPYQESLGEVQEVIDICDFAVGLSRQLYGLTMHSERSNHRMYEQYHPLGVIGVISAFNFPIAVWAWNAMIALACGNTVIWKPSEKTPFTAIATHKVVAQVLKANGLSEGVLNLIIGGKSIGVNIADHKDISLVSATGSTAMGKSVAQAVSQRLGKLLLELGGNNAIIVSDRADLDMTLRAVVFGAIGTAGQRCTTTRRLIIHKDIYALFKEKLLKAYSSLKIGNPLNEEYHLGPLVDTDAVNNFLEVCSKIEREGRLLCGGKKYKPEDSHYDCYVVPTLAEVNPQSPLVQKETFAPILYLIPYSGNLQEAINIQNAVPQGLSSAIFTDSVREAELFLSHVGSDCGIANVNIGTSGAEIGGAFGGEKETGGGREAGSDVWKTYMRRQTNTINYSKELPLAQGIEFNI